VFKLNDAMLMVLPTQNRTSGALIFNFDLSFSTPISIPIHSYKVPLSSIQKRRELDGP
jgi:hypothetical protein